MVLFTYKHLKYNLIMTRNSQDNNHQDDDLLGDEYDLWIDNLLDLSPEEQSKALDKLAEKKPELAKALRSSFQQNIFATNQVQNLLLRDEAQVGDRIGAWQLDSVLGQGGMGTVWCADINNNGITRRFFGLAH